MLRILVASESRGSALLVTKSLGIIERWSLCRWLYLSRLSSVYIVSSIVFSNTLLQDT